MQSLEGTGGFFVERGDGHDTAKAQRRQPRDVHCEFLHALGSDSPATGVVGEVDLHEDVEEVARGTGGVQRVGDPRSVDGVHGIRPRTHRPSLVRLRLADEVPDEIRDAVELGALGSELLLPVLADVPHAERVQVGDEGCRVELGHHDAGDLGGVAVRGLGGFADALVDGGEPSLRIDAVGAQRPVSAPVVPVIPADDVARDLDAAEEQKAATERAPERRPEPAPVTARVPETSYDGGYADDDLDVPDFLK